MTRFLRPLWNERLQFRRDFCAKYVIHYTWRKIWNWKCWQVWMFPVTLKSYSLSKMWSRDAVMNLVCVGVCFALFTAYRSFQSIMDRLCAGTSQYWLKIYARFIVTFCTCIKKASQRQLCFHRELAKPQVGHLKLFIFSIFLTFGQ